MSVELFVVEATPSTGHPQPVWSTRVGDGYEL